MAQDEKEEEGKVDDGEVKDTVTAPKAAPVAGDAVWWQQLDKVGFLISFESLLSTVGAEQGMIEDYAAAASMMASVKLRLVSSPTGPDGVRLYMLGNGDTLPRFPGVPPPPPTPTGGTDTDAGADAASSKAPLEFADPERHPYDVDPCLWDGSGSTLVLEVWCGGSVDMASLPPRLAGGGLIDVHPVFFTQGINEMQTKANLTGSSRSQKFANMQAMAGLQRYYDACKAASLLGPADTAVGPAHARQRTGLLPTGLLEQALGALGRQVSAASTTAKNVSILQMSEVVVRALRGGRVTSCKSAKDRTSMAMTLEQALLLATHHHDAVGLSAPPEPSPTLPGLPTETPQLTAIIDQLISTMRCRGVRLQNVTKNIGKPSYAFNRVQRGQLPLQYRPPDGTTGKVQS
jgi:hypothetical protein